MKGQVLVWLLLLCFFSCQEEGPRGVETSFYHWTTSVEVQGLEQDYLRHLQVKRLYLRFFDVDWDGNDAVPLAPAEFIHLPPAEIEIVPTIFITNRTLLELPEEQLTTLSQRIYKKIKTYQEKHPKLIIPEIQLDCDWSGKSKSAFFKLLLLLKETLQKDQIELSCTIRLHQVQYFNQTGVPPVDRGVLMFYNMGNVDDVDAQQTILNLDIARQYLDHFEAYPLALDVALPIFGWGVLIRDGKVIKLINQLSAEDLQDTLRFKVLAKNRFEVRKSTYLQGYYLYAGDQIRIESVTSEALAASASLLQPLLKKSPLRVIYYHLDSTTIKHVHYDTLQHISDRFR